VRVRDASAAFEALGFTPVAVGFSPADALAALAGHLDWPFFFCADEDRRLYHRLGLGTAAARQLFTRQTRAIYAAARDRGETVARPVEDPRQLGGDAIVVGGEALVVFRPGSPDDRPGVEELLAAAAGVG